MTSSTSSSRCRRSTRRTTTDVGLRDVAGGCPPTTFHGVAGHQHPHTSPPPDLEPAGRLRSADVRGDLRQGAVADHGDVARVPALAGDPHTSAPDPGADATGPPGVR